MKRLVCLLLVLLLVLASVPAFASVPDTMYVVKCEDYVSLREKPDTGSKRLAKVSFGEAVYNCTESGSKWVYCNYGGAFGYILKSYLAASPETSVSLPDQEVYNCKTSVSLRQDPSPSSTCIMQVPKGRKVTNCVKTGAWVECDYGSAHGFIKAAYLKKASGSAVTPVAIADQKVVNVNEWVSLRAEMSTSSKCKVQVPKGKIVTDCTKIGSWVECNYDGGGVTYHGYIKASYLTNAAEPVPKVSDTMVVVKVDSYVNLRQSASTKSASLGTVKLGKSVTGCTYAGNGFIECDYGSKHGYILAKYLKTTSGLGTGTPIPDQKVCKVNEYVSLRESPSTSALRLKEVPLKAVVRNCVSYGTWVYCEYNGKYGYVLSKYLTNA